MGSRLSRSKEESKKKSLGSTKSTSFLHISNRRYSQRRTPLVYSDDESNYYYSLPVFRDDPVNNKGGRIQESSVANPELMTYENEKSEKRKSVPQRMLPSIPSNTILGDSVGTERIHESARKLPAIACHTECRFDGVGQRCSSFDRVDDKGTEAQVFIEGKKEDPKYKLCQTIRTLRSYGAIVDPTDVKVMCHSAEAQTSQEPNKWKATIPEDGHTTADPILTIQNTDATCTPINRSGVTYMQLCSSDVTSTNPYRNNSQTCRYLHPSSEFDENRWTLDGLPNYNEIEEYASYQVPTQNSRNDNQYVRADLYLNAGVLGEGNAHSTANHLALPVGYYPHYDLPRPKTQAIVGPTSKPRIHGGVVLYPVQPGTTCTLVGATVEVPITLDQDLMLRCVEVGWGDNAEVFHVLTLGQHPITKVLHCLPHGSTFTFPVIVSVNLPVVEGQIEIFYSPTDVGQPPVWTKLRAIDAPENTHFTDNMNFVTLDRDRGIARFELRHFCAFFIVENGRVIEAKLTKASILLKNEFVHNYCNVTVRVVLGCLEEVAQQKMMEKLRIYKSEGYQVLEDVEFDLVASESKSMVKVQISQIKWMPDGDVTHGDIDIVEFELHRLWNQGAGVALFWQRSRATNGMKPNEFAATVHIQQDDRHDMRTKILCSLESPFPLNEGQLHVPVNDYTMIQRCDKLPKDLPSCSPLHAVPSHSSRCSSEYKFELNLISDRFEPEVKAAENLDRQQKDTEAEKAAKL